VDVTATTPVLPMLAELIMGVVILGSMGTVVAGIYLTARLHRRTR